MRVMMENPPREMYWELVDVDPRARQVRAAKLRAVYALVDPSGWDAQRHGITPAVAQLALRP